MTVPPSQPIPDWDGLARRTRHHQIHHDTTNKLRLRRRIFGPVGRGRERSEPSRGNHGRLGDALPEWLQIGSKVGASTDPPALLRGGTRKLRVGTVELVPIVVPRTDVDVASGVEHSPKIISKVLECILELEIVVVGDIGANDLR